MKKSKKIIGIISAVGALSLIGASCAIGITCAKANNVQQTTASISNNATSTSTDVSVATNNNQVSANSVNLLPNNTPVKVSSKQTSPISTNELNNAPAPSLTNSVIDTSTLNSNPTITFKCNNGNILLFSVNNNNASTVTLLGFSQKVSSNLVIPNTIATSSAFYAVTAVGAGAFYGQGLISVTFNNNLQSIGALAFANNDLTSLSFPANLQSIGDKAFISNQFPHAYAIYLPTNTTWNKNWLNCPFGCKDNFNKLTNGIQWVIQGTAVYSFQANQFKWIIDSYDITQGNPSQKVRTTIPYSLSETTNPSQHSYNSGATRGHNSVQVSNSVNGNIGDFALYTENQWRGVGWVFYFDQTNHTFNIWTGNPGSARYLFGNSVSTTLDLSLYDPYSGKYIVNLQNVSPSKMSVATTSYPYQIGDILTYKVNDSQHGTWAYIGSNFNPSLLTNSAFDDDGCNTYLNQYIDESLAWTSRYGLTTYFSIRPNGIFPTLATTTLTNVSYNPTSGLLDLVGTSLPNLKFAVMIDNKQVGTFSTNQDGQINSSNLFITKGLNASTNFTIQALSSINDASDVIYPTPIWSHLQGFNPKLGFLDLSVDNIVSQVLFNGISGKVAIGDVSTTWPAYASPFESFSGSGSSSDAFGASGDLNVAITTASGTATTYTFSYAAKESASKLDAFLTSLPYANGDTYAFSGSDVWINNVWNNNEVVGYYYNHGLHGINVFSFNVSTNGIESTGSQYHVDSYLNSTDDGEGHGANTRVWSATYGWMQCSPEDWWSNGYNSDNWYDPNQLMIQVANQICQGYSNPVDRMVAVFYFVSDSMDYTKAYTYGHTTRQTFQHMEGICGNIASLCGTMLKLAGFVSRQGLGVADDGSPTVSDIGGAIYQDNHMWLQVWMPSLQEWLTIDPTWYWYSPIGTLESSFNTSRYDLSINLVEWPEKGNGVYYDTYGTYSYTSYEYDNYFSYFKGCEYDALFNLGRYFDIPAGLNDDIYPYWYAQDLATIINWAANPSNSINSKNQYILGEI